MGLEREFRKQCPLGLRCPFGAPGAQALVPEWQTRDQTAAIHYTDPDKTAMPDLGANPRTPAEGGTKAPTSK